MWPWRLKMPTQNLLIVWTWTRKVRGAQFLCSLELLSFFRFRSKNGRRADSLAGSFPQDREGWRISNLVYCSCRWQDQDEAWDWNHSCASNWVFFNFLAIWASPSSPRSVSKGSPQAACSCSPGCPGRGSSQCSTGRLSPSSTSPTASLASCCFWEALGDLSGEAGCADLFLHQHGRLLIAPSIFTNILAITFNTNSNAIFRPTTSLPPQLQPPSLQRLLSMYLPVRWAPWLLLWQAVGRQWL